MPVQPPGNVAVANIIFDFGNVLFDIDLPKIEKGMRDLFGENFARAGERLRADHIFQLYETGRITTDQFVSAIHHAAPPHPDPSEIIAVWNSIFLTMPPDRFELLLTLRKKYKVYMLSNINDLHARWIDDYMRREYRLEDFRPLYFDKVYYSHLIHLRKPDETAFQYVLADAEIRPEETVFIDDLLPNVEAARCCGIQGIWHTPDMDIQQRMASFL